MQIWGSFVGLLETILLTFQTWTGNAGLAIILFTVLARLVILPLTLTSLRSSRRMQEIQPVIKDLQRKYGKDQQKLTEETMKVYKEYKINPATGCLPMLLQLPIFLAVYQAVINLARVPVSEIAANAMLPALANAGLDVSTASAALTDHRLVGGFLWLSDLGRTDPYYILPVLSVIFQLIVQLMSTPRVQDAQQKAMTQSMLILPIVFGYIGFTFPAGAVLYWVTGSIISMIQQFVISGWGSLANYLKFLPTDFVGLLPPITPVGAATAAAAAAHVSVAETAGEGEAPAPVKFWDVLAPLANEKVEDEPEEEAEATEQEIARVKRTIQADNPRRRKSRR